MSLYELYGGMQDPSNGPSGGGGGGFDLSGILGQFGSFGSKLMAASAARDYADDVAAARNIAYQNAITIANEQKKSLLAAAEFTNKLKEQNANILTNNAYALQQFALQEKEQGFAYAMRLSGDFKAEFGNSGVMLNTGSTKTTENYLIDTTMFKADSTYKGRLNQIQDTLNKASSERISGKFDIWNAKERGRFLDMEAQAKLY